MKRAIRAGGGTLVVDELGSGPPLLLLHGFSGSGQALAPLASPLARHWRVLSVDLPGHGASEAPRDPAAYSMERCTAQLGALLRECAAVPAHVFGYSMGGRIALALALHEPGCVRSLALLGASAGLADPDARAARVRADTDLAERIEREGVEAFAREWAELPLFASQQRRLGEARRAELFAERLGNRAHGLAHSLRGLGSGAQPPLHERLGELRLPVWLGAGAEDSKFQAIADELARCIPGAERAAIPAAGHAAHLENPDALLPLLEGFFSRAERPRTEAAPLRVAQGGPA